MIEYYAVNALGWACADTPEVAKSKLDETSSGKFLVLSYDRENHKAYDINFYVPVGVECTCVENNDFCGLDVGEVFTQ